MVAAKIGAKVVRHARYIAFQMAEAAIPRDLFADILRMIAELRPPPGSGVMSSSHSTGEARPDDRPFRDSLVGRPA